MPIADTEKSMAEKHEAISEKHSHHVLLYDDDGRPQNLPIPSSDPNDPLSFSIWRQRLILTVVCIYAIAGFGVVQTTPLFFGGLIREYKQQTRGVSVYLLSDNFTAFSACLHAKRHLTLPGSPISLAILPFAWAWETFCSSLSPWQWADDALSF
jgi:hypothetical protein